jgi:hypothetical protein
MDKIIDSTFDLSERKKWLKAKQRWNGKKKVTMDSKVSELKKLTLDAKIKFNIVDELKKK